jgi:hypothetical protein
MLRVLIIRMIFSLDQNNLRSRRNQRYPRRFLSAKTTDEATQKSSESYQAEERKN